MIELKEIEIIEEESFSPPYLFERLKKMYDNKRYTFLYSVIDGKISSYLILLDMVDIIEIIRVAVKKEYRGSGEGKKIIKKALKIAKDKNFNKILLEVRSGNRDAIGLYSYFGFEKMTTRKNYYSDGEDATIMMKKLCNN